VLKIAVHRALNELVACGQAETKIEVGKHGGTIRFTHHADMGFHVTRVTGNKNASARVATQ
jgi:hypothetical protein